MTPGETVEHRLIIRHPRRRALLLAGETSLRLPAFTSADHHTADVDYINRAVRERLGLLTTVLGSLRHSDPLDAVVVRVHQLQTHGDDGPLPAEVRWYGPEEASARTEADDAEVVAEWLATDPDVTAAVDGRDWTLPGWFAEVRDWLARVLDEAGAGGVREVVQLRTWTFSCVLLVRTDTGDFYFKAVPESLRRECAVSAYLAGNFPGSVAPIVATWPERRWFLTRALRGRSLEDVGDVAAWERTAAAYGRLQRACVERVAELRELGCPTRGIDALPAAIEALAADVEALQPGRPEGLSAAEVERLRAWAPELRRRCERLAACGLPLTLEHGDLWPGNVLVDDVTCAVIDWEDVAIGHPFFSLAPLTVGRRMFQPSLASSATTGRVEQAYLEPFAGLASPERLVEALRLAGPLGFIDMAARYRSQRPSVVRLHPWMRDLVPQTLRLALGQLDATGG